MIALSCGIKTSAVHHTVKTDPITLKKYIQLLFL